MQMTKKHDVSALGNRAGLKDLELKDLIPIMDRLNAFIGAENVLVVKGVGANLISSFWERDKASTVVSIGNGCRKWGRNTKDIDFVVTRQTLQRISEHAGLLGLEFVKDNKNAEYMVFLSKEGIPIDFIYKENIACIPSRELFDNKHMFVIDGGSHGAASVYTPNPDLMILMKFYYFATSTNRSGRVFDADSPDLAAMLNRAYPLPTDFLEQKLVRDYLESVPVYKSALRDGIKIMLMKAAIAEAEQSVSSKCRHALSCMKRAEYKNEEKEKVIAEIELKQASQNMRELESMRSAAQRHVGAIVGFARRLIGAG